MKKLLAFIFSFLFAVNAFAAVAFDSVTTSTKVVGPIAQVNPSLSFTHTVISSSNTVVFIFVDEFGGQSNTVGDDVNVISMTYGGNACTHYSSFNQGARYVEVWYYVGPSAGGSTISITWDDAPSPGSGVIMTSNITSIAFTGVDQVTPVANFGRATGTVSPVTNTVTTASANNMLVDDAFIQRGSTAMSISVSGSNVQKANHTAGTNGATMIQGVSILTATGGSQTMSWTESANRVWQQTIIEVAAAAAASTSHFLGTLGAGG